MKTRGLTIRLATRADDAQVRAVLRRNAMPGAMALAFAHDPCFFDAVEVEGEDAQVMVGEYAGQVVGVGLLAYRRVYLNGAPTEVGYLSSLRADSTIRGTTALARGYQYFRKVHEAQRRVPFYLSTIMEENTTARSLLTSGRAGLPAYHEIGAYHTVALPLLRRRRSSPPAGITIVPGSAVGAEAIVAFLNATGRARQFFPVYTAQHLTSPTGLLRGLALEDFAVALGGEEILGVLACWNQQPFRQHVVAGYHGGLRWLQPGVQAASSLLGCQLLPSPGTPVRCLLASCVAVRNDDPTVFRALLQSALTGRVGTGHDYLFIGLAATDPLLPVACAHWHVTLHSRIYTVAWEDGHPAMTALDGRTPYLELGSL